MKWTILESTSPRRLCDPFSAVSSFLGSTVESAASVYNNSANLNFQSWQNQLNREYGSQENQKNRDFNASEADKNRMWNQMEAEKQREWQANEWTRQFNMQREEWYNQLKAQYGAQWDQYMKEMEYNSPKEQVGRMQQAGLNASAVLGANMGGLASAAHLGSAGSPAVPTGGTVSGSAASGSPATVSGIPSPSSVGSPGLQNPLAHFGSTMRDIAAAAKDIATLRPMVEDLAASAIQRLADMGLKQSMTDWQTLQNEYFKATKDKRMRQLDADFVLTLADAKMKQSQGILADEQAIFTKFAAITERAKARLNNSQAALYELDASVYMDRFAQDVRESNSRILANQGAAMRDKAFAATDDALREHRVTYQKIINNIENLQYEMLNVDATRKKELALDIVDATREQLAREHLLTEQASAQLDIYRGQAENIQNINAFAWSEHIRSWVGTLLGPIGVNYSRSSGDVNVNSNNHSYREY